ncbi:MAG TPA: ammonia-forming cytochrome c nitrite reductase subunit c552, partial [Tenuifilaceae bacterium]|nr:ammonia-forming cytochrome c nitrite reductase subunit c552 [Tenuifilaceae bacterium]
SRVVSLGLEKAQEARVEIARILASLGYTQPVPMPDISTKAKAQAYIGLDMKELRKKKAGFLEKIVPEWIRIAKEREAQYPINKL